MKDTLPIGTPIRVTQPAPERGLVEGQTGTLATCEGWGNADDSKDAGGDYWARIKGIRNRVCIGRNEFEVASR